MSDDRWFDDGDQVLRFARILVASDAFTEPDEVVDYFEEPWKWDGEYQLWERSGCPDPPSSDDLVNARFTGGSRRVELERKHAEESARWAVYLKLIEARDGGEDGVPPLVVLPGR